MNKAKQICDREARGVPYVTIIAYIFDKGMSFLEKLTDEQIDAAKGNFLMKGLARVGRELSRNCSVNDIVELIKSEWCCAGEVYDPDRDQFIKDLCDEEEIPLF